MSKIISITVIILVLFISLTAGLLYSFSIAVSPGLKNLADLEFLKAMKSINREILNPLFFLCFFGPLLLFPVLIYLQEAILSRNWLLIFGFVSYLLILMITAAINVPLNNRLEGFDLLGSDQRNITEIRTLFENRWTFWNNIRTVLSITSLILLVISQFDWEE